MRLGAIADDFTGASDLGAILAHGGMRTVQYVGIPEATADPSVEAGIVALKTRSIEPQQAVEQSLAALDWLRAQGCSQFYFKYCSTFDSTPQGNIGSVIDALIDALGTSDPVIVCPAFPATGRTLYQGYLFVGDRLLSESGMENHPLNPMTDASIIRWLGHQTKRVIGHVPLASVRGGARQALTGENEAGRQIVVADAVDDDDLRLLAQAASGFELLTGGSGLALGLPAVHGAGAASAVWKGEGGPAIVLSSSCSSATRTQIAAHVAAGGAARRIEPEEALDRDAAAALMDWALAQDGLALLYTSDAPDQVADIQRKFGRERIALAIEAMMASLANRAVEAGVRRLVVAGGETSGAVVSALGVKAFEIGPTIDPGVPALRAIDGNLVIALKSGNFGGRDFFARADRILEGR